MKTVAILAALVVLASAKTIMSSGPNEQTKSLGASRVGGIEINDIIVEDIASILEFDGSDAGDNLFVNGTDTVYKVRQAYLNNQPFTVNIDVMSEIATGAMIKFFMGPGLDINGFALNIEDNWEAFFELDSFLYELTQGQNTIVRTSQIDSSLSLSFTDILQNDGLNFVVSVTNLI